MGEYCTRTGSYISLVLLRRVLLLDVTQVEGVDRLKGGKHAPPPSASWAENTIITFNIRTKVAISSSLFYFPVCGKNCVHLVYVGSLTEPGESLGVLKIHLLHLIHSSEPTLSQNSSKYLADISRLRFIRIGAFHTVFCKVRAIVMKTREIANHELWDPSLYKIMGPPFPLWNVDTRGGYKEMSSILADQ
jgi:hypothetical protein